jgi:hypothetical protein
VFAVPEPAWSRPGNEAAGDLECFTGTRIEVELRAGAQVRATVRGAGAPLGAPLVTLVDAAGNVVATATTGPDGEMVGEAEG